MKRGPSLTTAGFTLIELLVTLSILAALASITVPLASMAQQRQREAELRENLRLVRLVIDQFHADRGRYPDSLQELVDLHYLKALPLDPITGSSDTWRLEPPPDEPSGNVYDIRSGAPGTDRHGQAYADW